MSDTHFGYSTVAEEAKAGRVRGVFDSVARRYDVMNDLMSMGLHRAWKAYTVAVARVRPGDVVLDVAGGTGDLARAFAGRVGPRGLVVLSDVNEAMLHQGRDRLLDDGVIVPALLCDGEKLPFADATFDLVSVAFGLRNMTRKEHALAEMARVLKPGGRLLVLEFSKVAAPLAASARWPLRRQPAQAIVSSAPNASTAAGPVRSSARRGASSVASAAKTPSHVVTPPTTNPVEPAAATGVLPSRNGTPTPSESGPRQRRTARGKRTTRSLST